MDKTTFLLAFVIGGVGLVTLATVLLGWGRRVPLSGLQEAQDRLAIDLPDATVTGGIVADDGLAALLDLDDGRVAAVACLGDRRWTRILTGAGGPRIRGVQVSDEGLRIPLRDPGAPILRVALADADTRAHWAARLEA